MQTIVRAPNGSTRRIVNVNEIVVPDLWHIAMELDKQGSPVASAAVLETWSLCHDLIINIKAERDGVTL
jgi:hypothetical protein